MAIFNRDAYTTGGDPNLLHRKFIGEGNSGHVHELYDIPTGKTFARKLLHIPRDKQDGQGNEIRAIRKLCGNESHKNIVTVLRDGPLNYSSYYFIDMELCDLNLDTYIHRLTPPSEWESIPYFIKNSKPPIKAQQIWNVMRDISSGVKYIHSHDEVHRDLKPANILYSRKDSCWKLADFGLTSEGTAIRKHTTNNARGTMGYRAPELLTEMAPSYNNKLDIWAMGCILYELAVGQKLFYNDYAVFAYEKSDIVVTLDDTFSEQCKEYITKNIEMMLQFDSSLRPSATEILDSINRYYPSTMDGITERLNGDENHIITDQDTANATDSGVTNSPELLIEAASKGLYKDVVMLLAAGADPMSRDKDGSTPLNLAAQGGHLEIVKILLTVKEMDIEVPDGGGHTALHSACHYGHIGIVKCLLNSKADITAQTNLGESPLQIASLYGHVEVVRILLNAGAVMSAQTYDGWMALHHAQYFGYVQVTKTLLRGGADIEAGTNSGETPLHIAALHDQAGAIRALLDAGADISAQTIRGETALHIAALHGKGTAAKTLLDAGADITAQTIEGKTALQIASARGHRVVKMLLDQRRVYNHIITNTEV